MKVLVSTLTALAVLAAVPASAGAVTSKRVLPKTSPISGYSNGGDFGTVIGPRVRSLPGSQVMINPQPLPPKMSNGLMR